MTKGRRKVGSSPPGRAITPPKGMSPGEPRPVFQFLVPAGDTENVAGEQLGGPPVTTVADLDQYGWTVNNV